MSMDLRGGVLILACVTACGPKTAQIDVSAAAADNCAALVLDLETGTMNGVSPTASIPAVEQLFPCSTGSTSEEEIWNYGGGVFFLNHDFFVYTGQDWIEVRGRYTGRVVPSDPRGLPPAAPGPFAQPHSEGGEAYYTTSYGCLRLSTGADGTVDTVAVHARSCDEARQRE